MQNRNILLFCCISILVLAACTGSRKVSHPDKTGKKGGNSRAGDPFLTNLFGAERSFSDSFLQQSADRNIQVIYTRIDRNAQNEPRFTHFFYNSNLAAYHYPASTVKLPIALLALQKLNGLAVPGLDRNSTMITGADRPGQTEVYNDPTSGDGRPTIAHYLKKLFLVSDNDASNRLYEFLGGEYINRELHRLGLDSAQILHRLGVHGTEEENRHTNPVTFYDSAGKELYRQPGVRSGLTFPHRSTLLGKGYLDHKGVLVDQPFDFSAKNRLSLPDLHSILMRVIFPQSVPKQQRFGLTEEDYTFLYRYMAMAPREAGYPQYDSSYNGAYVKFLLYGGRGEQAPGIRVFNKVGNAYGFLTDAAYVVDCNRNIEFMLSATVHCNPDGIYNDDRYDYDTFGYPLLKRIGEIIYQYELGRERKNIPDLGRFNCLYNQ